MDAILPGRRAQLGALLHGMPQNEVISRIPQFAEAAVHTGGSSEPIDADAVHALVFNMERGENCAALIDFLQTCPALQPFDIILANELDDGCTRSAEQDTAREIARALHMYYVFALEFIELRQQTATKAFHGNAIFSRFPIRWAKVLRLPEEYNWFFDRQSRIGGRCAVFAELNVNGRPLGVVSIHLENRTSGEGRLRQMQAIYKEAQRVFPQMPVLLGGDLNTNTFDGRDKEAIKSLARDAEEQMRRLRCPEAYEPLLSAAESYGFTFLRCEGVTRRKPLPDGGSLPMRLDWLLSRGLREAGSRIISTKKEDCSFAPAGSALAMLQKDELSDHNAVWARYRL